MHKNALRRQREDSCVLKSPARLASVRGGSALVPTEQQLEERLGLAPRIGRAFLCDNRRRWGRLALAQLELVGEAIGARHGELAVVPGPLGHFVALPLYHH